jgi:hypothetical protein
MFKVIKLSIGFENLEEYQANIILTIDKYPSNLFKFKTDIEKALNNMYEYPPGTFSEPVSESVLVREKAMPEEVIVEEVMTYEEVPVTKPLSEPKFSTLLNEAKETFGVNPSLEPGFLIPPVSMAETEKASKEETNTFYNIVTGLNQRWFIKREQKGDKKEALVHDVIKCLDMIQDSEQGKYIMANLKSMMNVMKDARIQNAINNAGIRVKKNDKKN